MMMFGTVTMEQMIREHYELQNQHVILFFGSAKVAFIVTANGIDHGMALSLAFPLMEFVQYLSQYLPVQPVRLPR